MSSTPSSASAFSPNGAQETALMAVSHGVDTHRKFERFSSELAHSMNSSSYGKRLAADVFASKRTAPPRPIVTPLVLAVSMLLSGTPAMPVLAAPAAKSPSSKTPVAAPITGQAFQLSSGEQRDFLLPKAIDRIAVADPTIADALVLKPRTAKATGSLLLVGKKTGNTNLLVWYKGQAEAVNYDISVDAALLKGLETQLQLRGNTAVLSGMSPSVVSHAQTAAVANYATGKGLVMDQSTVGTLGTVQVDVRVIEFSKTALKQAGINFGVISNGGFRFGSFSPNSLTKFTASSSNKSFSFESVTPINGAFNLLGRVGNFMGNISLLQSNGLARVLAEPTLVAQSGQSASFLAGGEIPIPIPQSLGTVTIEYKQFGISLNLTPTVLGADRIALKIAPEASELDYTRAITLNGTTVPAILTRRADTTVELGNGESYVIGGLVSKNMISSVDKVPLLGDLPVLGPFFKNINYQNEEKELVIIVTPRLVKPLAYNANTPPLPGDTQERKDRAVWTPYLLGGFDDSVPGFSK